jgi:hypothetical protein
MTEKPPKAKMAIELTDYSLGNADEQYLLAAQKECTFIWSNKKGEPVGVVMTFLAAQDKLWLLVTEKRARVTAVRRDPRTSVVITSAGLPGGTGKTVTYKGTTRVHAYDNPELQWVYHEYVSKLNGENNMERIEFFKGMLAVPERVIFEFIIDKKITYDGDKMAIQVPGSNGKFDDMWK